MDGRRRLASSRIEKRFQQLVQSRTVPIVEMVCTNRQTIQNIIEDLDSEGRWLSTFRRCTACRAGKNADRYQVFV